MCLEVTDVYERMWNTDHGTLRIEGEPWTAANIYITPFGEKFAKAGWTIRRAPGLVIVSYAWVHEDLRDKGFGKFLAAFRVEAFHQVKADGCRDISMICRVRLDNERQKHILKEVGWKQLSPDLWVVE